MDPKELAPVLTAVRVNAGLCGRSMIAKLLRGSRDKRLVALGLDLCSEYGALADHTIERIGYLIDEALALGLIGMQDAGWSRGRNREEAHFPVLSLTERGARALRDEGALAGRELAETAPGSSAERARLLAIRAMVQGAYALEDHKHQRIEAAEFVRESPGAHVVLFAMERHPWGERLMCLYVWDQRTNTVVEIDTIPVRRVPDRRRWFERHLTERRRRLGQA